MTPPTCFQAALLITRTPAGVHVAGNGSVFLPCVSADPKMPPELLLLHVDSGSKKLSLRGAGQGAGASGLKPCELKFAASLSSLVRLTCR